MAAFASCRRSGAVRVMVLLLCALFIFSTLGAPAAQALGVESVAVFGLASVLSAATAALGFKLASNEQGQATLQKMVQDFKTVAWATGFVLVGSKLNGLQNGMDYIKMQVQNGKTYLDSRVFAWVQQWLAKNGVYDAGGVSNPSYEVGSSPSASQSFNDSLSVFSASVPSGFSYDASYFNQIVEHYSIVWRDSYVYQFGFEYSPSMVIYDIYDSGYKISSLKYGVLDGNSVLLNSGNSDIRYDVVYQLILDSRGTHFIRGGGTSPFYAKPYVDTTIPGNLRVFYSNGGSASVSSSNTTGLSGTDTLGKDVIDLTLDQILEKLKDWAQDWFDAGADSATNAATGAQDLPLTVATGAATANPSIAEDGPLVWFPSFGLPIPSLRTGETDTKTVDQGKENANTADKTEAAAGTVEETQTIVDSLLNWASDYISPDKGLFSKFPLCIPYDAYLLVCSALGVDALGVDDVVGSSPGDVQSVMGAGVEVYSDFQAVINVKHELKAGGTTYPIAFTLDLSPFEPIVKLNRIFVTVYVLAELIASEYKRIRSS